MPSDSAGSRTDTDVGPAMNTPPPVAVDSAVRLATVGSVATVEPAPSSSSQPPEAVKPSPVSLVVQPSLCPVASEFAEMTAAYSTPVTGAPGTPSCSSTIDAAAPGTQTGSVAESPVSLIQRRVAVFPPTVAVSRFAENAVDVAPKPEPVRFTTVPPAAEAVVAVVVAVTGVR